MKQIFMRALHELDHSVHRIRTATICDPQSPYYGTARTAQGLSDAGGTGLAYIGRLAEAYTFSRSSYYRQKDILDTIEALCFGVDQMLHEDGTGDLTISNFRQPEYFCIPDICYAYRFMSALPDPSEDEKRVTEKIYHCVERSAMGLLSSGFHTPNHRWVHTSALYHAYNTLREKDERFTILAEKYLAEKIDIDEYGEFSERSAGMYSAVSDRALCGIAVEAGKPELFDLVKRNLRLVYRYLERESFIFTQNSRRKDKGEVGSDTPFDFQIYTDICLISYANTRDPEFLQILFSIASRCKEFRTFYTGIRPFLLYPILLEEMPDLSALPPLEEEFHAFYPNSGIVRAKDKTAVYSIVARNPVFFHVTAGDITISARMCSSFFAMAQFLPDAIEKIGEKQYRMRFQAEQDYKLPFDEPPKGSENYWSMDFQSRKRISRCEYGYTVDFTFTDNGILLHVTTAGTPNVPFKLEFTVTPNVYVRAGNAMTIGAAGSFICANEGNIELCNYDGDSITIKNAFAKHFYHKDMRGSIPSPANKFMVYLTDFSPVDRTVEIICEKEHTWDYYLK